MARLKNTTQACYRSIALAIGLTAKSVKTKVDNMISGNVIERLVTLVNRHSSAIIGYVLLQLERDELSNEVTMRITK